MYLGIFFFVLMLAAIFVAIAWFASKKYEFNLSNDSLVLTFVGVLATFVVISNYIQVQDIKSELKKETQSLNEVFENKTKEIEQDYNYKFDTLVYQINEILHESLETDSIRFKNILGYACLIDSELKSLKGNFYLATFCIIETISHNPEEIDIYIIQLLNINADIKDAGKKVIVSIDDYTKWKKTLIEVVEKHNITYFNVDEFMNNFTISQP